jgi:hypothetical protein
MKAVGLRRGHVHGLRRLLPWLVLVVLVFALGSLGAATRGTGDPGSAVPTPEEGMGRT